MKRTGYSNMFYGTSQYHRTLADVETVLNCNIVNNFSDKPAIEIEWVTTMQDANNKMIDIGAASYFYIPNKEVSNNDIFASVRGTRNEIKIVGGTQNQKIF